MTLLERYIGKEVLLGILASLLTLLILLAFVALLKEVEDVGRGDYGSLDAFLYVLFTLPRHIYDVFPVAVLLGSLVGLGGLASHSELTAMRASGVSLAAILATVLKAGILVIILVAFVGEVVAPASERMAEAKRAERISQQVTLQTEYGFWARDGNAFVNIRYILPDATLRDIYIYEYTDDGRLRLATHAEGAEYRQDHWLLKDIRQSRFEADRVVSEHHASAAWNSMLNPSLLDVVVARPMGLPAWGLYRYIQYMHDNGQDARVYEVAFWTKVVSPLVTLIMLFLSVPFVFGALRTVGIGQRIFVGALVGTAFLMLNKAFGNMAIVYDLNPVFAALFPGLLFLGIGVWFLRRIH